MICTETILISAIVDSYFYADTCVDQAYHGGRHSDEVRVATVRSTGKSGNICHESTANNEDRFLSHERHV